MTAKRKKAPKKRRKVCLRCHGYGVRLLYGVDEVLCTRCNARGWVKAK